MKSNRARPGEKIFQKPQVQKTKGYVGFVGLTIEEKGDGFVVACTM
jgi:hypothetical protein